ncbi:RNA polymerase sigma factor [Arenibacter certesii]|uniref:ECF subfamily RNA polymerase sigma factor n=1 Tax=Arenibacter certesii TaxID=228955 RepID=A0A918IUF5_9FLAO|nr:RNA polymerase sigma factor [Arenibacter certesii]GGW33165.1 ECF subfamily RNA polymerase sigma factor [Arenibacter certesii]
MAQVKIHIDSQLQLCLKGNRSAQMEVYDRYYKGMYNISKRIVKDSALAEDIMQESFLSAFTKLGTFKGEVSFGAWLKRIVINNSIQEYRKQCKRQEVDIDHVLYKIEDNEGYVTDMEVDDTKAKKVIESMKLLNDNYRIALTLHLIEGMDYEEISDIMHISYANCRTIISRAKNSLRQKLTSAL